MDYFNDDQIIIFGLFRLFWNWIILIVCHLKPLLIWIIAKRLNSSYQNNTHHYIHSFYCCFFGWNLFSFQSLMSLTPKSKREAARSTLSPCWGHCSIPHHYNHLWRLHWPSKRALGKAFRCGMSTRGHWNGPVMSNQG